MSREQPAINFAARPLSRRDDPASSMRAAKRIVESGKRQSDCCRCFAVVDDYPGVTARWVADLTGIEAYTVRKRLADLRNRGLAYSRRPADGGELTWFPGSRPEGS